MKRQWGTKNKRQRLSWLAVFIGPRCPEVIVQRDCSADIWLPRAQYSFTQTHAHTQTNPIRKGLATIPLGALLKACNLG